MPQTVADMSKSVVLAVDVQPNFMKSVDGAERILARIDFLARCAHALGVPTIATVQNPMRMGGIADFLVPLLSEDPAQKMSFSCSECELFRRQFVRVKPKQVVIVGVESHICVLQTTHDLLRLGHEVFVCADAVGSRTPDRHENGLERTNEMGAAIAHSESIVYEWMKSAEHPNFRDVLQIVKSFA